MPVQTFEALTDDEGIIRLAGAVSLPAHTKVYVIVPEQTTRYEEIVPEPHHVPASGVHFPLVRVVEEGLTRRLVKTIVEDSDAKL